MTDMRDVILWVSILGLLAVVLLVVGPAPKTGTGYAPDTPGYVSTTWASDETHPVIVPAPAVPVSAPTAVGLAMEPATAAPVVDPTRRVLEDLRDAWQRRPIGTATCDVVAPIRSTA